MCRKTMVKPASTSGEIMLKPNTSIAVCKTLRWIELLVANYAPNHILNINTQPSTLFSLFLTCIIQLVTTLSILRLIWSQRFKSSSLSECLFIARIWLTRCEIDKTKLKIIPNNPERLTFTPHQIKPKHYVYLYKIW